MKVLFAGLGSIGLRHLKNLTQLASERGLPLEVHALRSGKKGALPADAAALVQREAADVSALDAQYDLAFITGPTALHAETLSLLKGRAGCWFIEKPIFSAPGPSLKELGLDAASGQKAYVAAPMRWCGVMQALKKELPALAPYSVRAICSSYLPDWRPGVDYRTVYSARRELGGGVGIDLIHEWDYLADLFGLPLESACFAGKYSHLEIDSDDLAVYIARYPGLLAELHLDYFGRGYRRTLELFCRDGTAVADFGEGTLTLPDGRVIHCEEPLNQRYLREMDYFLSYALTGQGTSVNSPETALRVLSLSLGLG